MAKFSIYSSSGELRHTGYPKYVGAYLDVPYLEFATIESPFPINWERGDRVFYSRTGLTYRLYSAPLPKKQAKGGKYGAAFVYSNVKFYSAVKELEIAPFRDVVSNDNRVHFSTRQDVSTFEDVYGIATRIQENINDVFPGSWEIRVFDTADEDLLALFSEKKEFSVSGGSCLDALSQIYETWKNVGWTHTYENGKDVITIGRTSLRDDSNTTSAYAYGKGQGLTSIKKMAANEDEFATRLYIYGSDRNIQTRYYNGLKIHNNESVDIRNLMLPIRTWGKTNNLPDARKAYIQASADIVQKYGLIPRTVYFDGSGNEEIYPSITGLTQSKVRTAMINAGQSASPLLPPNTEDRIDEVLSHLFTDDNGTKQDIEANGKWTLWVRGVGFNIAEQGKLTEEGYATISMKGGACAGREFKVLSSRVVDYAQELTLERTWDESLGMGFPNGIYPVEDGDQFVLLDIPMPDYYITLAEERLLEAGVKLLQDYTRVSAYYEPTIDPIAVANGNFVLREGMYMQVADEDVVDTESSRDYVLIDTITIEEKGELPAYRVTLREQKRSARTFGTLEEMIDDTKRETSEKINRQREYTERRFRSAQETIDMLQGAFSTFSEGISPITVQTMSMLVGDESLQFRFVNSKTQPSVISPSLYFNKDTKRLISNGDIIQHMTLGIDTMAPSHLPTDYKYWNVSAGELALSEANKPYYIYIKASKSSSYAYFVASQTAIAMESASGYYHFLTAIINSEIEGSRSLVFLNGFTEVLPGQVTTQVIRDSEGKLVIDLAGATITAKDGARIVGDIEFGSGSSGLENLQTWKDLENNLSGVEETLENLQNQIDGVVENYFLEGAPTVFKAPVTEWTTEEELLNHIGDTYTNINTYTDDSGNIVDKDAGKSWRWCECTTDISPKEQLSKNIPVFGINPEWVYMGTIDTTKEYQMIDLLINGTRESVAEFVYDTPIRGYAGPPWYVKIQSNGEVYVLDEQSYIGGRSLTVRFFTETFLFTPLTKTRLHWHIIADTDATKALEMAKNAQATADGKRRVFTAVPYPPYDIGDLWASISGDKELRICVNAKPKDTSFDPSDWDKATKYTSDASLDAFIDGEFAKYKEQVDGKIDTYYEGTDPSANWGDVSAHTGDLWFKDGKSYVWNGAAWEFLDGVPKELYDKVDRKKQVFYGQPTTPYYVADLWVQGETGDLMVCKSNRESGSFNASDWEKGTKYSDGSNTTNLLPGGEYITTGTSSTSHARIYPLPFKVNGGEKYTFKCESSRITSGSQTRYRIKLDGGDDVSDYTSFAYLNFGENQFVTLTIKEGVVNGSVRLSIVKDGSSTAKAEFERVSLVRSEYPMQVWEDYKGDNGLENLLSVGEEYVGQYNQYFYFAEELPFVVNAGDTYTVSLDSLDIASGTSASDTYGIMLYAIGGTSDITSVVTMRVGQKGWGTLRVKDGISNSTARLMIYKNGGSNALAKISRLSLVKGSTPLVVWKENPNTFKDKIISWADDNQFSPAEISGLESEMKRIAQENIDLNAEYKNAFGGTDGSALSEYNGAYSNYYYDLNAVVSAYNNAEDKTKPIAVPSTFDARLNAYYEKKTSVVNLISDKINGKIDAIPGAIANDYGYLKDSFKQITSGKVFLADMMGVGQDRGNQNFTVNAFLNGSDTFVGDNSEGKLMLATGIPSSGGTLEERAKEATTRIYEKGKIETNNFVARGHVDIGGSVRFTPVTLQDAFNLGALRSSYNIGSNPPTYLSFSGAQHTGIGTVTLTFTKALSKGRTIEIFCEPLLSGLDATLELSGVDFFLPTISEQGALTQTTKSIRINGGKIELYYSLTGEWIVTSPITSNITIG